MSKKHIRALNTYANSVYEYFSEVDTLPNPELEAAVQALCEAADQVSFLTCALLDEE